MQNVNHKIPRIEIFQSKESFGAGEAREMHLFVQTGTQHSQYLTD